MEKLELIAIVMRNLWLRRNRLIFEDEFINLTIVMIQLVVFYDEFLQACKANSSPKISEVVRGKVQWTPPAKGKVKVD